MHGQLRTVPEIQRITERLKNEQLTSQEAKGFYGTSTLLQLPTFNFIDSIPAEYMHSVCHGVIKRLLELSFKVGETRERITARKLSDPQQYNDLIANVQVPRDFSRRLRTLDLGVMKAQ